MLEQRFYSFTSWTKPTSSEINYEQQQTKEWWNQTFTWNILVQQPTYLKVKYTYINFKIYKSLERAAGLNSAGFYDYNNWLSDQSSGLWVVKFGNLELYFEIKMWYLSAYPKGIQGVGVFFSSVDPILIFLGQTVLVCQSYNGRYRSLLGLHDISFQHRYRDVRIRNSHIAGCAMFSRPILFVIYILIVFFAHTQTLHLHQTRQLYRDIHF